MLCACAVARVLQLADHVVKGVTGWIAILEAQIVGSKLPNQQAQVQTPRSHCTATVQPLTAVLSRLDTAEYGLNPYDLRPSDISRGLRRYGIGSHTTMASIRPSYTVTVRSPKWGAAGCVRLSLTGRSAEGEIGPRIVPTEARSRKGHLSFVWTKRNFPRFLTSDLDVSGYCTSERCLEVDDFSLFLSGFRDPGYALSGVLRRCHRP
jgi:hypothetical protein